MTQRHKGDVMVEYRNTLTFLHILKADSDEDGYAPCIEVATRNRTGECSMLQTDCMVNVNERDVRRVWLTPELAEASDPPEVRDLRDQMHAENCNSVLFNGPMGVCDCKRTESADIPAAPLEEL